MCFSQVFLFVDGKKFLQVVSLLMCLIAAQQYSRAEEFQLEGKIEHSQTLPPVQPDFEVGKKFDERKFRSHHHASSTLWWRVPGWLVGSWQNVGRTHQIKVRDLHSNQTFGADTKAIYYPEQEVIGLQKDSNGDVWTTVPTPYFTRSRIGRVMNVHQVTMVEPVQSGKEQVVLRLIATTYSVDMGSNKILSISQRESLQTYRSVDSGKIIVLSSVKFYDDHGEPKYTSDLLTHSRRHAGFTELQYWTAPGTGLSIIDLRKSFVEYLHKEKLDYLIPRNLS